MSFFPSIFLLHPAQLVSFPFFTLLLSVFASGIIACGANKSGRTKGVVLLRKIFGMINSGPEPSGVLGDLLDELIASRHADAAIIWLSSPSDLSTAFVTSRGFDSETAVVLENDLRTQTLLKWRLQEAEPASFYDLASLAGENQLAGSLVNHGLNFLVLCPIRSGSRTVGVLGLCTRRKWSAVNEHADLMSAVTEALGMASANSQLREHATKLAEDLISLQEFNKIISQSFDLEEIVRRIVIEGKRLVKTSQCHLFLLDEKQQNLVCVATTQTQSNGFRGAIIELSRTSRIGTALLEKRVIACDKISDCQHSNHGIADEMHDGSAIFAPILTKDLALGVLICSDRFRERSFTPEEVFRAETFARHAAIALENARLFRVVSRSQKEWETTFDAMQDCVSVHDPGGKIVRANVALAKRLKTTPPKVIGKLCSELYGRRDEETETCRHMQSLQSEGLVVEEQEIPLMGGTFQISVTPWYDKNNRLAGSIHVAKDITNEMLLRQQLIQSEKLSAIGELISGIAHELNNPLTGVMGYSQLLQLRKDIDERAKESLLKINNLALRCQKIVQNLLSFARKQKPERKLSDINDLLERTVELRCYELQVNNIEIHLDLDRSLPKTIADSHQIQQVFLNIITNGEQAMLEANGRGCLSVRTRCDRPSGRIVVEISDDGPGISESFLNKIFDPFFTTKEVGKGTGLGLSLSYGIIKEHDGNIYARSKPGEGATFVVELPIISQLEEQDSSLAKELLPQALRFENVVRNKRLLVVDDEKYILDFFTEVFRMYPMEVDTAENGRAAMDRIRGSAYDLIVTDFKMPEMSGRELFDWIKAERPEMTKRIIFVTGDTVSSETRSFFEETSNRYLAKPFKIEEVKEVIQQTLESCESSES